jgi:carbamoyl-phosphate synthase large subunit
MVWLTIAISGGPFLGLLGTVVGVMITFAAIAAAGIPVEIVNKVAEGRPHVVDMIKNNEIALVINTVEEKRTAIHDSRTIRTSALAARVTTYTTIAGAEAAVEGMAHLDQLHVYDLQSMHASLH